VLLSSVDIVSVVIQPPAGEMAEWLLSCLKWIRIYIVRYNLQPTGHSDIDLFEDIILVGRSSAQWLGRRVLMGNKLKITKSLYSDTVSLYTGCFSQPKYLRKSNISILSFICTSPWW